MSNCIEGTLDPYIPNADAPWNKHRIKHLYNRIGNGANLQEIEQGLLQNPGDLVDALIDEVSDFPLPSPAHFPWVETPYSGLFDGSLYRYYAFRYDFAAGQVLMPVRNKLALFWHSHFATDIQGYQATFTYLHYRLLLQYAWGNFKEFTEKMGLDPRMMRYLNVRNSSVGQPNENYARELLELFTLGEGVTEGVYTQEDIANLSRVFTGWRTGHHEAHFNQGIYILEPDQKILYPNSHDWGEITLFGQTLPASTPPADIEEATALAHSRYLWAHDVIFEQKEQILARFICRKLYKFYVYHEADETIVEGMAETFINNNWEIAPVLRQLFKSQHFYNENAIGVCYKGTVQLLASYVKKTGYVYDTDWFSVPWANHPDYNPEYPWSQNLSGGVSNQNHAEWLGGQSYGQHIFEPPNVAGWPGGRHWINEYSLVIRRYITRALINLLLPDQSVPYIRNFLEEISGGSTDPEVIVRAVIDHHFSHLPDEVYIERAVVVFMHDYQAYFDNGTWDFEFTWVIHQYKVLMHYLVNLPDFQMC